MVNEQYRQALRVIREAVREQGNITGAMRLHWPELEPLIDSRYITVSRLANDAGAPRDTISSAIRRIRREQRARSAPASTAREPSPAPPRASTETKRDRPASKPAQPASEPERPAEGKGAAGVDTDGLTADEAADLEKMIEEGYQPLNDGSGKYWKRHKGMFKVKRPGVRNARTQDEDPRKPTK